MTGAASRSLFLHCLRFDVFEAGPDRSTSRLYGGALAASALSAVLAAHLLDGNLAQGVGVLLLVTGLAAFLGLFADVAFTWFDPRDVAVLQTVPVSSRRYFFARARALSVTLLLKTLAWGLVPAGVLVHRAGLLAGLAYLPVLAALLVVLAALATVLLMLAQRLVDPAWLRDALVWLQVGMFVAGTAGWLLFYGGSFGGAGMGAWSASWLPSSAFAALWQLLCGDASRLGAAGVAVAGLVLAIVVPSFAASGYLGRLGDLQATPTRARAPRRAPLRRAFERAFVDDEERGAFRLAIALLRRERTFRLQTYPLLVYPVLFLAFGSGHDDGGLFSLLFAHLGTIYLPLVGVFLRYSDTPQAAWVLRLNGASDPAAIWAGARKAMVYCLVLPLGAIVIAMLCWEQGIAFGLGHGSFTMAVMIWVSLASPAPADTLPFSDSFRGGVDANEEVKQVYPLFMLVVALGVVQLAVESAGLTPLLAVAGGVLAFRALRRPARPTPSRTESPRAAQAGQEQPPSLPFAARLRAECRGLAALYAVLAVFGWCVGWMS